MKRPYTAPEVRSVKVEHGVVVRVQQDMTEIQIGQSRVIVRPSAIEGLLDALRQLWPADQLERAKAEMWRVQRAAVVNMRRDRP